MRVYAAITLAAAFIRVSYVTADTDWSAVSEKINEIKQFSEGVFAQIKTASKEDNPTVGKAVEKKVHQAHFKTFGTISEMNALVTDKRLTTGHVNDLVSILNTYITDLEANLKADFAQLSAEPAKRIRTGLVAAVNKNKIRSEELMTLLNAK